MSDQQFLVGVQRRKNDALAGQLEFRALEPTSLRPLSSCMVLAALVQIWIVGCTSSMECGSDIRDR